MEMLHISTSLRLLITYISRICPDETPPEVQATFYLIRKSGLIRCVERRCHQKGKREPISSARVYLPRTLDSAHTAPLFFCCNWLVVTYLLAFPFPFNSCQLRNRDVFVIQGAFV